MIPPDPAATQEAVRRFRAAARRLADPIPDVLADLAAAERTCNLAVELPLVGFSSLGSVAGAVEGSVEAAEPRGLPDSRYSSVAPAPGMVRPAAPPRRGMEPGVPTAAERSGAESRPAPQRPVPQYPASYPPASYPPAPYRAAPAGTPAHPQSAAPSASAAPESRGAGRGGVFSLRRERPSSQEGPQPAAFPASNPAARAVSHPGPSPRAGRQAVDLGPGAATTPRPNELQTTRPEPGREVSGTAGEVSGGDAPESGYVLLRGLTEAVFVSPVVSPGLPAGAVESLNRAEPPHPAAAPRGAPGLRSPQGANGRGWGYGTPEPVPAAPRLPDADTLAELVNDALVEQARRHGVDLS